MTNVKAAYLDVPIEKHITLSLYRALDMFNIILCYFKDHEMQDFLKKEDINYQLVNEENIDYWLREDNNKKLMLMTYSIIREHKVLLKYVDDDRNTCYDLQKHDQYSLKSLMDIMAKLRGETGCPWDRKQTHKTLLPHLIEEAYEVIEAVESGSLDNLCEELGDVLLQVIFHCQISEESQEFSVTDVLETLKQKLIRRHPHVFEDNSPETTSWDDIKKSEQNLQDNSSILFSNSTTLPALIRAEKIQKQARKLGFDWEDVEGAYQKLVEEVGEVQYAYQEQDWEKLEEELGDLLFTIVNLSRFVSVSSELALSKTITKFERRLRYIEQKIIEENNNFNDYSLQQLDKIWEEAKNFGF